MSGLSAAQRRAQLLQLLQNAQAPVSASELARTLGVSRQIIVGDVALLRAGGETIDATPRGYCVARENGGVTALLACCHRTAESLSAELYAVVDNGGEVLDVTVENPLYGQITGQLSIASRYDADCFLRRAGQESLLCSMTGGVHLHRVRARTAGELARIRAALQAAGVLYEQEGEE